MFAPVTLHAFVPAPPPAPPPPPTPSPALSMSQCQLCRSLLRIGDEAGHRDWHLVNGLHGARCALLRPA